MMREKIDELASTPVRSLNELRYAALKFLVC